jgi:hypothetical protein
MSLPSRWMRYCARSPAGGVSEMLTSDGTPHQRGQRAVGENEAAVRVVRDGDRDRRAVDDGLERQQALAQVLGTEVVENVEGTPFSHGCGASHHSGAAGSGGFHAVARLGGVARRTDDWLVLRFGFASPAYVPQ